MRLDSIVIGQRARRDAGDLDDLAASISRLGLLHPVVVSPAGQLVAGWRRLKAVKLLGWRDVPVTVIQSAAEASELLAGELHENVCRKNMSPIEKADLAERIAEVERVAAEQRKGGRPKKGEEEETSGKLPEVSEPGATRAKAAAGAGISEGSLAKIRRLQATADDAKAEPEVREAAAAALEEIHQTDNVDGPYKRAKQVEAQVNARKLDEALEEAGSQSSKVELDRARLVANYTRLVVQYQEGLLALDPEYVAQVMDDGMWRSAEELAQRTYKWFAELQAARPKPMQVIQGGRP